MMVHLMTVSFTLWLWCNHLMIRQSSSLLTPFNIGVNLCLLVLRPSYGAAREWHNEPTRNILKHSCAHKWWETLKCPIFGVKHSIPALRGLEVVWWWLLLRKPQSWVLSLTACSFLSSFSLLCLVSLSLGAILCSAELLSCVCFLIFVHMGCWVCFLHF